MIKSKDWSWSDTRRSARPETFSGMATDTMMGSLRVALEGESRRWYFLAGYEFAEGVRYEDFRGGGRLGPHPDRFYDPVYLIPFREGCALLFATWANREIDGKTRWRLDREAMRRGALLMCQQYPEMHWGRSVGEITEPKVADAWLQMSLFGKIVFD